MTTIFRPPIIQRITRSTFVAAALFSVSDSAQNTLLTTLARPFNQTDWPVPRGPAFPVENRTFVDSVKLNLLGKDKFFGLAGAPQFDWPVPKGAVFPTENRTFINQLGIPHYTTPISYVFRPPLVTRIWPKFYLHDSSWIPNTVLNTLPKAVPSHQTDWPNPRGPTFPTDLRTFVNSVELQLIGKDLLFGAAGQVPTYDWQNPRGKPSPNDYGTWVVNLLQTTLQPAAPVSYLFRPPLIQRIERKPYFQETFWNNLVVTTLSPAATQLPPGVRVRLSEPIFRKVWFDTTTLGGVLIGLDSPPGQVEAQMPTRARYVPGVYDIAVNTIQNTLSTPPGTPTVPIDWSNPIGVRYSVALRTWVVDLLHSTLAPLPGPNVIPLAWPNPLRAAPDITLRTWIDPLKLNLIGQDTFFGAPGQPPTYDWPNPGGLTVQRWRVAAVLPVQGGLPPELGTPAVYTSYGGPFLYTAANWGFGSFYLEVYMRATSGTVLARLYNETTSTPVTGSGLSTNSAVFVRLRSGALTLTDASTYRLQLGKSALDSGEVLSGQLIVT